MNNPEEHLPASIAALVAQVSGTTDPSAQDALVAQWTKEHKDTLLPFVTSNEITFVYYEASPEQPIEKVALVSAWNSYEKDKLFLHRVGSTDLFYLTLEAKMTNTPFYYYSVTYTGEDSGKKKLDPFNPAIQYSTTFRNVVHEASDPDGFIHTYRQIQPVTTIAPIQKRDITVFLPPGYYDDTNRSYPVLYMHDGQNVWDSASANYGGWKMDTTLVKLMNEGKVEPMIIVGMANTSDRSREYVGFAAYYGITIPAGKEEWTAATLKYSYAYEDFVVRQVKPMIDGLYRTLPGRENTAIAGSSFGGGASLFIAFRNTDVFGKVASLSGGNYPPDHFNFPNAPFVVFSYLIDKVVKKNTGLRVYLDCGDRDLDATFLPATRSMREALLRLGYREGVDLSYYEAVGRGHNEQTWALNAPKFLTFLFPAR